MFNSDKKIRIPNEFALFGHKYKVVLVKDLFEKEACYGSADEDLKLIKLQELGTVIKRYEEDGKHKEVSLVITEEVLTETLFHEVTHIILDAMGEDTLSENEKFVNMMGKAWLEIYLSTVYEEDSTEKEEV